MDQTRIAIAVILLIGAIFLVNALWTLKTGKRSLVRNIIAQVMVFAVLFGVASLATGQLQPGLNLFLLSTLAIILYQLAKRQFGALMKRNERLSGTRERPGHEAEAVDTRERISYGVIYLKTMRQQGILLLVLGVTMAGLMYLVITPRDVSAMFAPLAVALSGLFLIVFPGLLDRIVPPHKGTGEHHSGGR